MTDRTIILLVFLVCAVLTINVYHVCQTWRVVTLMKLMGVPAEMGREHDELD